ncbi:MAG: TlyA family RNA methyltransferase [Alphaproteobacteria bacterium]|nr:TlyA family RNA methyltransferase [Alphaproteobacteria bacterium]
MKVARQRLDQALVDRGLVESRTRAQALVLAGKVFSGERRLDKPGQSIAEDTPLEVRGQAHPWVSRGGLKLDHGLATFGYSASGITAVDVGASTGGFTHVLVSRGAAQVFAVDVGWGQLHWSLRTDPRVIVLERTNARHLTAAEITTQPGAVVCDASFIGLMTVLPATLALALPGAWLIALIKPQFEVGRDGVGKGGVVRDPDLRQAVCDRIAAWLGDLHWQVDGITESPITGPEGNVEYLIGARKPDQRTG